MPVVNQGPWLVSKGIAANEGVKSIRLVRVLATRNRFI